VPPASETFGSSTIRVEGAFNPAIVTPDWLLAKGLINEADREFATARDMERVLTTTVFSGAQYPAIAVEVTRELLYTAATEATETPEVLRNFVIGLLRALPETPVHRVSVQHFWHIVTGAQRLTQIAQRLAPAEPWASMAPQSALLSLRRFDPEGDGGTVLVVERSVREHYDLYLAIDRQWELGDEPGVEPVAAIACLEQGWARARTRAEETLDVMLAVE
jgi:hypothetical protein